MKSLITILDSQAVPDGAFYYSVTVLLCGALIWVILSYVKGNKEILKDIGETLRTLRDNDIRQDSTLKHHDERLDALESPIVKYKGR